MAFIKTALIAVSLAAPVFCGFQIGVGGGYGLPAGGTEGAVTENTYDATGIETARDWKFTSFGNGFKIDVDGAFFFNNNFGVMFATGYGLRGGWTTKSNYPNHSNETKYESSCLPLNLGVKIKADFDNLSPYVYAAPGLYFPSLTSTYTTTQSAYKSVETYEFNVGLGIASGLGVVAFTSKMIGIKIELFSNYAYASVQEITDEITLSDGSGRTVITKFVDKADNSLVNTVFGPTQTLEDNNFIQLSYSSIGGRLGLVVRF